MRFREKIQPELGSPFAGRLYKRAGMKTCGEEGCALLFGFIHRAGHPIAQAEYSINFGICRLTNNGRNRTIESLDPNRTIAMSPAQQGMQFLDRRFDIPDPAAADRYTNPQKE
jgi:hypothetical protein